MRGEVAFDGVTFSYDGKPPAVEDLTFKAEPGETIALVGATGAGKSTAMALLYRVYDPQSGKISIDGRDIRDVKLTSLRRNIGVIFQEPLLFNRSIAENLRVGNPDATDAEILDACKRAEALDFIERQGDGLNSTVGERGRMLSGGERQRLSIARALLKDPPILILDEATSALDAATEAKVTRRAQRGDEGPHHLRHRPPACHGQERDAHPGVRPRPHRRERQLRCAGGKARRVRQTRRSPVPRACVVGTVYPRPSRLANSPIPRP